MIPPCAVEAPIRAAGMLRSLAAQGFASAILPRSLTSVEAPALEVRSLDPAVHLPVALVWRRERNPPAGRLWWHRPRRVVGG
jgi:DNA-binding transcriptional LysR family regulator